MNKSLKIIYTWIFEKKSKKNKMNKWLKMNNKINIGIN